MLVLHWRGIDKTRQCLKSLADLDYPSYSILLVDNGSETHDGRRLQQEFPHIELLRLESNQGFAGGCNRGMEHALKTHTSYIWLLNNDALAHGENLKMLTGALKSRPEAGAAAALVLEGQCAGPEDSPKIATGLGKIDFVKAKTYLKPLPESKPEPSGEPYIACDWVTGSNLLLKTSVLKQVGLFDERFFLYFEDVDLCFRIRQAGYACLLVTSTMIEHEGSASTQGGLSLWRAYYHTRNRLLFFSKNAPLHLKPLALAAVNSHILKHCLTLPWRGAAARAKLRVELSGLKDFYAGKFGQATCLDWCENFKTTEN